MATKTAVKKKPAAKKTAARKTVTKKKPVRKPAAKKATARKTVARKAPARKPAARKAVPGNPVHRQIEMHRKQLSREFQKLHKELKKTSPAKNPPPARHRQRRSRQPAKPLHV